MNPLGFLSDASAFFLSLSSWSLTFLASFFAITSVNDPPVSFLASAFFCFFDFLHFGQPSFDLLLECSNSKAACSSSLVIGLVIIDLVEYRSLLLISISVAFSLLSNVFDGLLLIN